MNFKDLEKQMADELGPVDIMRAIDSRPAFEKDVIGQIGQEAVRVRISARDRLYEIEIFISPDLNGDYFEAEFTIELAIKEACLKELRNKDLIKDFSISSIETLDKFSDSIMVAKISFNPQNFLKKFRDKKIKQPGLIEKGGRYYLRVSKEKEIYIGKENSNPVILLKTLLYSSMASLEDLYHEMTKGQRDKPNLQLMNPEQKAKRMLKPIRNAMKEIQKVLNPYFVTYLWKDDQRFPKRVSIYFKEERSAKTKVGK